MAEGVQEQDINEFLTSLQDELGLTGPIQSFCEHLTSIGVKCKGDLYDVKSKDIPTKIVPLKHRRKVIEHFEKNVPARGKPLVLFDNIENFLAQCELSADSKTQLDDYLLVELEISDTDTLRDLTEDDFEKEELPLTKIEWNRFVRLLKQQAAVLKADDSPSKETDSVMSSATNVPESSHTSLISIQYIHFNSKRGMKKNTIDKLSVNSHTMENVVLKIMKNEEVDVGECTVELYSWEGYPLNINMFTNKKTLSNWKVKDNDFFYVFTRKKVQPGETSLRSLPPVDHEEGIDEVEVVSGYLHETVKICFDSSNDSPDILFRKVYHATGIPTTHMALYCRDPERSMYKELDLYSSPCNGDVLTMVLKNPAEGARAYTTEYGKGSYNMLTPQTDKGLSAFFSILRYIITKKKHAIEISLLLKVIAVKSQCPPLVHSLKVLNENSCLDLSGWVPLLEGFFMLFNNWLSSFGVEVDGKEVFEFSDYFWAAMIQDLVDVNLKCEDMDTITESLLCPISKLKITSPRSVCGYTSSSAFDEQSLLENIGKKSGALKEMKDPLSEDVIVVEEDLERLLLYNPWRSDLEVIVWKQPPECFFSPPDELTYDCPYEWNELAGHLDVLDITVPYPLRGMGSLTFIEEGRLVIYMGFTKDNDMQYTVYDPLENGLVKKNKEELKKIMKASLGKNITSRDMTKEVSDELRSRILGDHLSAAKPKPHVNDVDSNWKACEAIMVILDTSGSMGSKIPKTDLDRLKLAKHSFEAYHLRTQAYDFNNAVGLINFNSLQNISIELNLGRCSDEFEEKLNKLEIEGTTALHSAMKMAADKLLEYDRNSKIPRRILCLTDGYEGGSEPQYSDPLTILNYLRERNIIVDTVLLASDNVQQKAISHATGGACFRINTVEEALKLFEMETLLSYVVRCASRPTGKQISQSTFSEYKDTQKYPFDTHLRSNLFENTLPKTLPIARTLGEGSSDQAGEQRVSRILKEISELFRFPLHYLEVFPKEESVTVWMVLMKGPVATPYAGGVFLLQINFHPNYPRQPPDVRFHEKTPIYHCNINSNGRICHKILGTCYSPRFTMRDILASVYGLLIFPEPDDPLDSVIAEQLLSSRFDTRTGKCAAKETEFWKAAETHTKTNAQKEFIKWKQELSGESQ